MIRTLTALVITAFMVASCATDAPAGGATVGANLPPPDTALVSDAREYLIGPLDTLEISVFQASDLGGTVVVDSQGQISLPLIGTVPASGKSTRQLSTDIAAKLREKYMQAPQVTVLVKESISRQVTVEGAVAQPGMYPIAGRTTLLQVIALARGVDRYANERQVAIFRTVDSRRAVAVFDLRAIRQGKSEDPEVYGNDVVVIERSSGKSLLHDIAGVTPIIGIFRFF